MRKDALAIGKADEPEWNGQVSCKTPIQLVDPLLVVAAGEGMNAVVCIKQNAGYVEMQICILSRE